MGINNKKYVISENFQTKIYLNEDFAENALLVAGFVPVIGEVADIILILRYLKQKRYIESGLMLVALIPTFGDFVVKPFLKIGKAVGAFGSAGKFANFLKTDAKAAKMYAKVGEGFKNPLINKLINQVRKVLPNSAKEMETATNLHINMWGKVIEKEGKNNIGSIVKQGSRQSALNKYLIKTNGVPPSNFLSSWWNVVYKGRRARKDLVKKVILSSNLMNSLGIFSIQDLENKMSNEQEAEKLISDPKFKEVYDQINSSSNGEMNNTEQPQEKSDGLSSILTGSGAVGISSLKTLANIMVR